MIYLTPDRVQRNINVTSSVYLNPLVKYMSTEKVSIGHIFSNGLIKSHLARSVNPMVVQLVALPLKEC